MAISCLGFNTIALFSRQIFKIDDALVNASLIFWFCFVEMLCSVPGNSPKGDYQNIWLAGEHSEPIATIHTLAPLSVQAVFQFAPAPISSWFLCPRPPLLFSAPNQNCHAAQAKNMLKENTVRGRWWQLILDLQCNISVTDIASFVCMITMFTKVLFVQSWENVTTTFWGYNTLVVLFSIRAVSCAKFVRSLWRCLFLNII